MRRLRLAEGWLGETAIVSSHRLRFHPEAEKGCPGRE